MIWLVRHGETDYNRAPARVQGQTDVPLNDTGRAQAQATALRIKECGALFTSHLLRARETAEIVGEVVGAVAQVDERLAESRRGSWEGRDWGEIERSEPEEFAAWRAAGSGFRFPGGGESLEEQRARVVAALEEIDARAPQPAVVVCHGGSIRVALCHSSGRGLGAFHEWDVPNGMLVAWP